MRKFLLTSAAIAVTGGAAFAAEPLEPIAPPPPPMAEPFVVPTWAGPYVGADIGWGWADFGDDDHHNGLFNNGLFNHDDDELDGLVGGVFAGWLGQSGTFLYGVEVFGQIAELDAGDDDDGHRFFRNGDRRLAFTPAHGCFIANTTTSVAANLANHDHAACAAFAHEVHALFGLEGMIGWGGDRTAFLLHAGPALGWFKQNDDFNRNAFDPRFTIPAATLFADDDEDNIELGVSVAAEGRFKLTERVFAGVIGRAFWFPGVGDDDGRNRSFGGHNNVVHDDDDDVTVFEVKARLGMTFGQPAAAAPLEAGF